MSEERTLLVDASVFIALADVGALDLLRSLDGQVSMPQRVADEVTSEPAGSRLESALGSWIRCVELTEADAGTDEEHRRLQSAGNHLGRSSDPTDWGGDVPLVAAGLQGEDRVVVTDDKPLRQACRVLSIPVSGSIGVLIRGVERGDLDPGDATATLEAMDEVGARLSASLYRRAERMIDEAAGE